MNVCHFIITRGVETCDAAYINRLLQRWLARPKYSGRIFVGGRPSPLS
jgi:hypothetical protein